MTLFKKIIAHLALFCSWGVGHIPTSALSAMSTWLVLLLLKDCLLQPGFSVSSIAIASWGIIYIELLSSLHLWIWITYSLIASFFFRILRPADYRIFFGYYLLLVLPLLSSLRPSSLSQFVYIIFLFLASSCYVLLVSYGLSIGLKKMMGSKELFKELYKFYR